MHSERSLEGYEDQTYDPSAAASQRLEGEGSSGMRDTSEKVGTDVGSSDTEPAQGTVGPHDSNLLNVIDPRVQPDFNQSNSDETEVVPTSESGAFGTGPARGTTGPHESNILNIIDPRVQPQLDEPKYEERQVQPQE